MSQGKPRPAQKKAKPKLLPDRFLKASGSGYVQDPKYALGQYNQHPTPLENILEGEDVRNPPEPAAVDKETQKWITQEAHEHDALRNEAMPLHEELRAIEAHLRPEQRSELRRRIEGLKRSTHEKAA